MARLEATEHPPASTVAQLGLALRRAAEGDELAELFVETLTGWLPPRAAIAALSDLFDAGPSASPRERLLDLLVQRALADDTPALVPLTERALAHEFAQFRLVGVKLAPTALATPIASLLKHAEADDSLAVRDAAGILVLEIARSWPMHADAPHGYQARILRIAERVALSDATIAHNVAAIVIRNAGAAGLDAARRVIKAGRLGAVPLISVTGAFVAHGSVADLVATSDTLDDLAFARVAASLGEHVKDHIVDRELASPAIAARGPRIAAEIDDDNASALCSLLLHAHRSDLVGSFVRDSSQSDDARLEGITAMFNRARLDRVPDAVLARQTVESTRRLLDAGHTQECDVSPSCA